MLVDRIVIVENDEISLAEKVSALREKGFQHIFDFVNPEKALNAIKAELLPIDLLITDLQMNPMNGHELIEELLLLSDFKGKALLVSKGDKPLNYTGHFLKKEALTEDYISSLLDVSLKLLGKD